jgi:hypothetical protein
MPAFESLLDRLIRQDVRFVIVGGFAAVAHGVSLMTEDLDICCPFTEDNLRRLHAAIADLHPVHRMTPQKLPFELTPQLLATLKNVYLRTDFGILDCLGDVKGLGDYEAVKAGSITVTLSAGPCRILGIDALIHAKRAMGGTRDLETIRQLEAIKEERARRGGE